MDHMRISGIEPLSVILCQTANCKKKNEIRCPKMPIHVEAKSDGVINPISIILQHRKCRYSQNATNQPKSTMVTCFLAVLWSTSSDTHHVVEIQNETSIKID